MAEMMRAPSSTISSGKKVEALIARHGKFCRYCNTPTEMYVTAAEIDRLATREHLIPTARGGTNEQGNLAISCGTCNRAKGDMTDLEFKHLIHTGSLHPNYAAWLAKRALSAVRSRIRMSHDD